MGSNSFMGASPNTLRSARRETQCLEMLVILFGPSFGPQSLKVLSASIST